ncbi:MAG: tyrosine-type recombinase/integrase [Agitococcus sp.]|nr:tyrosine-type recombinase/integrase [Agitococcus sp.]
MKANLTERLIKSLKPTNKPYEVYDNTLIGLLLRVQPTGSMTFYVNYSNVLRKRNRTKLGKYGHITLTQARDLAKQRQGEIATGIDPQEEKKRKIAATKVAKAKELLLREYIKDTYTPWVVANRKSGELTLHKLYAHFDSWMEQPMESFTAQQIEEWQVQQKKRGLKPTSINRNFNALRSVFTRAFEVKAIHANPLKGIKNVTESNEIRVRYFSIEEEFMVRQWLKQRDHQHIEKRKSVNAWRLTRGYSLMLEYEEDAYTDLLTPIILLAMNTGLRRGELLQLSWSDINFEQHYLTVRAENAKSGKARRIPLNAESYQILSTWKRTSFIEGGFVFSMESGNPLTTLKAGWRSLMSGTGIKDFRLHDLRHHFASKLAMKGADLNTIRELLGHSDFTTTLRYAHLADSHKADAVALLV